MLSVSESPEHVIRDDQHLTQAVRTVHLLQCVDLFVFDGAPACLGLPRFGVRVLCPIKTRAHWSTCTYLPLLLLHLSAAQQRDLEGQMLLT